MNLNEYLESYIANLIESVKNIFPNSKVRDKQGNLIKCYHGTCAKFDKFDVNFIKESGAYGKAFYFTDDLNYAKEHTNEHSGGVVKEVYLNIEHPYYFDYSKIDIKNSEKVNQQFYELRKLVQQGNHDGLIVTNDWTHGNGILYMVYKPEQIYIIDEIEVEPRIEKPVSGFPSVH